jgi:hypothetical protein
MTQTLMSQPVLAIPSTTMISKAEENPGVASRSSSSTDVEAANGHATEKLGDDGKPHFPVWQWVLTLVGLYTGALLYGKSQQEFWYTTRQ